LRTERRFQFGVYFFRIFRLRPGDDEYGGCLRTLAANGCGVVARLAIDRSADDFEILRQSGPRMALVPFAMQSSCDSAVSSEPMVMAGASARAAVETAVATAAKSNDFMIGFPHPWTNDPLS
jgi:hypothetical protein